ncbi:hypothetical protein BH09BAC6_BH09BAC6_17200 [soil metagenome]|jgi:hypothetical protein
MSSKDVLALISAILKKHTRILNEHTLLLKETNNTLKQYIDISIQQFQFQQNFNERFLNKLGDIEKAINKT